MESGRDSTRWQAYHSTIPRAECAVISDYEAERLAAIRAWQARPPGPATRWFGRAAGPASRAVQTVVPASALRTALNTVHKAAARSDGNRAILSRAGVESVDALRTLPLAVCDGLADRVQRRALLLGGAGGAVFGVAGTAGMVLDISGVLVLALRTIRRMGLCYGDRCLERADDGVALSIFAAASANSVEEKMAALRGLRAAGLLDGTLEAAWRDGVERAAERELAKEAATYSMQNLARSLSVHLGWRKAASAAPVLGAFVGGSVNAWYINDVAQVARYCFQERWLLARYPEHARLAHDDPPQISVIEGS